MAGIGRSISGARGLGFARWVWRAGIVGLVGLAALSATGCSSSFQWSGKWSGKRDLPLPEGGDPSILATISKVELSLEAGGRFELLEGGLPKSGTFRSGGPKAYLKVTHFMERPIESLGDSAVKMNQEIVLSAQKDGTILFDDPGGIAKGTVVLSRSKPESQR
jgi:hypothetical protein